jgi:hypothetical protein
MGRLLMLLTILDYASPYSAFRSVLLVRVRAIDHPLT